MKAAIMLVAALVACAPYTAMAQEPCGSLDMALIVRVETAGVTEAAALEALAGEVAAVRNVAGTSCITEWEQATKVYTDGSALAAVKMRVQGSEAELRGIAASLEGAAKPVKLVLNDLSLIWSPLYSLEATIAGAAAAILTCMLIVGILNRETACVIMAHDRDGIRSVCTHVRSELSHFFPLFITIIFCAMVFFIVRVGAMYLWVVARPL